MTGITGPGTSPPGQAQHMDDWLKAAFEYIPQWLQYQMRESEQPGCVIAIAYNGRGVLEEAFGYADIVSRAALTPRHRFRVASHSKSFTAAGIMKLREAGKLGLDDHIGRHVRGLHPTLAEATIAQLLSHTAGIVRDGSDDGQWQDRRPFLDATELRADLAAAPVIEANTRFLWPCRSRYRGSDGNALSQLDHASDCRPRRARGNRARYADCPFCACRSRPHR
jgi:CubicO group peptidase (beta-lactamase class C family)